jgi:CBS domain-containing protein
MSAEDKNIALIIGFIAIAVLAIVVALRSATAGKVEITLNDAIIAVIGAALALLVSGKISKFVVGSGGVTIETAFVNAAGQSIAKQVTPLPVAPVEQALKGGLDEISEMVRRKVEGLDLMLGAGGYVSDVIKDYLLKLTQYHFFRYVILLKPDNRLFGIIDARALLAVLTNPGSGVRPEDFASLVNNGRDADRDALAKLPTFVPADDAVRDKDDKRAVLERMENSHRDWLPVVGEKGQLAGIVERSRLIASMILDITTQLKGAPQSQSSPAASSSATP